MKTLRAFGIAFALLSLMSQVASARTLTVTGLVDGRDLLYITPTGFHWHHLDFAAVGRYGEYNFPTGLDMSDDPGSSAAAFTRSRFAPPVILPLTQYLSWIPSWPCQQHECRDEQVDSSTFLLQFPLPSKYDLSGMTVIQAPPGGSATVYQYPSAANDYTTIIDFNDDDLGGPHWYKVQLTLEGQQESSNATAARPALLPASSAGLATIYSNLGTGDSSTGSVCSTAGSCGYDCCTALTSSERGSFLGDRVAVANGFTPAADSTITQVQIALGNAIGTNAITVSINSDNGGVPGSVIKQWYPANLPTLGTCCSLVTQNFSPGIPVTRGTQYWLVVRQDASSADAWNGWNLSSTYVAGPTAISVGGQPFTNRVIQQQGAFAIIGQ